MSQQFVMGTLFRQPAGVDDDDAIGAADGAEAMGDDEGGTPGGQAFDGLLDERFGFIVERG